MNLSAILVLVQPDQIEEAVVTLNGLRGVEVHVRDDASGRIIVVLEAPSIDEEVAGLHRIQTLPVVLSAELVYHYFAEDQSVAAFASDERAHDSEIADAILLRLNDHLPA